MYRINSVGDVATSFSSGLPFPSEPGRVVYNAIGDALAFAITPGAGATADRIVTLGNCDGVGGYTGGTSCVTAIRNGTGAANADGVIDASLIGPNGDQAGTFYFRTRGLTVRNNNTRETVSYTHLDVYKRQLQGLRRMLLATRDAHELYTKIGFRPLAAPHRFMERHNPNAYAPIHAVEG